MRLSFTFDSDAVVLFACIACYMIALWFGH